MHERRINLFAVLSTLTTSQLLLVDKHSQLLRSDDPDDQSGSQMISDTGQNIELETPIRALLREKLIARSKDPAKQRLSALG